MFSYSENCFVECELLCTRMFAQLKQPEESLAWPVLLCNKLKPVLLVLNTQLLKVKTVPLDLFTPTRAVQGREKHFLNFRLGFNLWCDSKYPRRVLMCFKHSGFITADWRGTNTEPEPGEKRAASPWIMDVRVRPALLPSTWHSAVGSLKWH